MSRYPVVEILHSTSAQAVIPKLDKIFAEFGIPEVVRSDNGPPFNSREFQKFALNLGFHHRRITPEWPEGNGEVENFMKSLKKTVRISRCQGKAMLHDLWTFLRQYRATPHCSTKVTPAEMIFGRGIRTEMPSLPMPTPTHDETQFKQNDAAAKAKMKKNAERKRRIGRSDIKEGDKVLLKNPSPKSTDSIYFPQVETVLKRKGDMLTTTNGDRSITRNISRFKKLRQNDAQDHDADDVEEDSDIQDCPNDLPDADDLPDDVPDDPGLRPDVPGGDNIPDARPDDPGLQPDVPGERRLPNAMPDDPGVRPEVPGGRCSRSGRAIRRPRHLKDYVP